MSAIDLQRRLARAMARGKGSMMITQTDLGILLDAGAYEAVCSAATEELKHQSISRRTPMQSGVEVMPTQRAGTPDMEKELARALATLPKPR